MWEYVIALLLIVIFITLGTTLFTSHKFKNTLADTTMTRGVNGNGGEQLSLSCPSGQTISFTNNNPTVLRAALICGSALPGSVCDPFLGTSTSNQTTNFFNPSTTVSFVPQISSACQGKNSCTITVPTTFNATLCTCSPTNSGGSTVQLVGTYDCVA